MTTPRPNLYLVHTTDADEAGTIRRMNEQAALQALLDAPDLESIGRALKGLAPYLGPDLKAVPLIDRAEGGRHD